MNQGMHVGRVFIKLDGALLPSMPDAKLDVGGKVRKPVVGSSGVYGFTEELKESTCECEIAVGPNTDVMKIHDATDVTLTFECDNGQVYIVRNAFSLEPPAIGGGGGKAPFKFSGQPAEKV